MVKRKIRILPRLICFFLFKELLNYHDIKLGRLNIFSMFTNELNDHLFRSAVLRSREYNRSDIDFHRNLERTLHRFDTGDLSTVSVNKMLVNLLKNREGKQI